MSGAAENQPETGGAARPARTPPSIPDYQLHHCIGRGSYGEVWLARSTLGTWRAVKVIYRDAFDSERPFLREFNGIKQFEPVSAHESQVSVYHVGRNDAAGYFYYVMELADDASISAAIARPPDAAARSAAGATEGEFAAHYLPSTLSLRLKRCERLACSDCIPIAIALASALAHLHGHGLVHRDIKPSNIVFVGGRPKLADIGLVADASSSDTLVGTAGYIPPEGPGTPAADLYSFGKVLYEMATGCDRQDFPNLPENFLVLPDREQLVELNEVILRCCHGDPRKRYEGAAALLADLQQLHRGRSLRLARARRRQAVVAGVAAVVVLGGIALWNAVKNPRDPRAMAAPGSQTNPQPATVAAEPRRWTNSLGMVFVPVTGLPVAFSVWETRAVDFRAFITATGHKPDHALFSSIEGNEQKLMSRTWEEAAAFTGPDHPVRAISAADARAFCGWLTTHEQKSGMLKPGESYRLPKDAEWSWAAGLTNEVNETRASRQQQSAALTNFFWGTIWPPPTGAGSFSGAESIMIFKIAGYVDLHPRTAPVGSFASERAGLFDLGGNVSEFCDDTVVGESDPAPRQVVRGGNWESYDPAELQVSARMFLGPREAKVNCGFRIVRAPTN